MRGFIAIPVPKSICKEITQSIKQLKSDYPFLKWVREENYHLTLAFLGEISHQQFIELNIILENVQLPSKFSLEITNFGLFPGKGKMRILWLGFTQPTGLKELHNIISKEVIDRRLIKNHTAFKPHLTLARSKEEMVIEEVDLPKIETIHFTVEEFNFYKSDLHPSGPIYTVLKKYLLT